MDKYFVELQNDNKMQKSHTAFIACLTALAIVGTGTLDREYTTKRQTEYLDRSIEASHQQLSGELAIIKLTLYAMNEKLNKEKEMK